jgi:hypothetical protein
MEGAARPFFRACRTYGVDSTVIALCDLRLPLSWSGINAFIESRVKEKRLKEYSYDLLWMLVNAKYDKFNAPMPSEINRPRNSDDKRSAEQIKTELLKRLIA